MICVAEPTRIARASRGDCAPTRRIALVRRRFTLEAGGAERYAVMLASALVRRGHQITLVGIEVDEHLAQQAEFVQVPMPRVAFSKTVIFARRAAETLAHRSMDAVLGLARMPGANVLRVTDRLHAAWMRVRYSNRLHRGCQHLNPRHRGLLALERAVFESPALRRVIVQSELDRRLVQQHYHVPDERIRTIYNGVDSQSFHPNEDRGGPVRDRWAMAHDEPLLLFASASGFAAKGLASLIRSMKEMRHREARLLVVGCNQHSPYGRLARELGLERRVIFVGRQSEMQRYYAASDLFLLPTAYEPQPNVCLESLACGTPVVTSQLSGTAEIIESGQNGFVLSGQGKASIRELAELSDHFISLSTSEKRKMRAKARAAALNLPLAAHVEQVVSVLEEAIAERRQAR